MNLPLLTVWRPGHVSMTGVEPLRMSINYGRANQHAKPPFEGVSLAWRSHHATSTANTHIAGRLIAAPLKRATQRRTTNRLLDKALPSIRTHDRNRIHDGQTGIGYISHSLPTSQSGQNTHTIDRIKP